MNKIAVGILGATGMVGQRFVQLLFDHPWFEVAALAASDRSAGQRYADACRWLLAEPLPDALGDLIVQPVEPNLDCTLVFSALPSGVAGAVEQSFAEAGYAVCSNAAAHRLDADVPLLIPEVNPDHTALIDRQRRRRGGAGFIVTSPNCSSTQLALVLKPLQDAFGLTEISVVTMQAVSGAGYPGIPAMEILGNVVPFISGEEDKVEREPLKLLGSLRDGQVLEAPFVISAQCNRVPVRDGHLHCASIDFESLPGVEEVTTALQAFSSPPEVASLPSSQSPPIIVHERLDRPQPVLDRHGGNGMSVSVGHVRECAIFDVRMVVLGHNTLRGAAGGSIHNAELLVAQGWITP
jgi:aspartate-semialdehyde dehydrogenase